MIGDGVVRRQLEDEVEVRHRALRLALGAIRHGAVVDRQRAFRIELDRLGQVGDGALVVALLVVDMAQRVERFHIVLVEYGCLFEILCCAAGFATIAEREVRDCRKPRRFSGRA